MKQKQLTIPTLDGEVHVIEYYPEEDGSENLYDIHKLVIEIHGNGEAITLVPNVCIRFSTLHKFVRAKEIVKKGDDYLDNYKESKPHSQQQSGKRQQNRR